MEDENKESNPQQEEENKRNQLKIPNLVNWKIVSV